MRQGVLIYAGGFKLPDGNASAQRAVPNAQLFKSIGFDVVLVGKQADPTAAGGEFEAEGFRCFDINQPDFDRKYPSYDRSGDTVKRVVDLIGASKVAGIVCYNYAYGGWKDILPFCRENDIVPVADTTEWYALDNLSPIGIQRFLQHEWRMRVLQKKVGNLICAGRYLRDYYARYNTVIIPNCVDMAAPKWHASPPPRVDPTRRFIYAGSPGAGMKKEYVHWLLDSFLEHKRAGRAFLLSIVGITEAQLLKTYPDYLAKLKELGSQIEFFGRVPHLRVLDEMKNSDFSVFLRPDTRVNRAGCPTKLAEAFACGIPTISNKSGDVEIYLGNPRHGFLFDRPDRAQLTECIGRALALKDDEVAAMKAACAAENPFRFELYQGITQEFFARAA